MTKTHDKIGTCGYCGRAFTANRGKGVLAKHGYTRQWGSEQGQCPGSHMLALEVSPATLELLREHLQNTVAVGRKAAEELPAAQAAFKAHSETLQPGFLRFPSEFYATPEGELYRKLQGREGALLQAKRWGEYAERTLPEVEQQVKGWQPRELALRQHKNKAAR